MQQCAVMTQMSWRPATPHQMGSRRHESAFGKRLCADSLPSMLLHFFAQVRVFSWRNECCVCVSGVCGPPSLFLPQPLSDLPCGTPPPLLFFLLHQNSFGADCRGGFKQPEGKRLRLLQRVLKRNGCFSLAAACLDDTCDTLDAFTWIHVCSHG